MILTPRQTEAFWAKTVPEPNSGCLLWTGNSRPAGYGRFRVSRTIVAQAHRVSYELSHGSIPDGLLVCHRCDTPACVNPEHLFLGTSSDNALDMYRKGRAPEITLPKDACPNGHMRTDANIYTRPNGTRFCSICALESQRRRRNIPAERQRGPRHR